MQQYTVTVQSFLGKAKSKPVNAPLDTLYSMLVYAAYAKQGQSCIAGNAKQMHASGLRCQAGQVVMQAETQELHQQVYNAYKRVSK